MPSLRLRSKLLTEVYNPHIFNVNTQQMYWPAHVLGDVAALPYPFQPYNMNPVQRAEFVEKSNAFQMQQKALSETLTASSGENLYKIICEKVQTRFLFASLPRLQLQLTPAVAEKKIIDIGWQPLAIGRNYTADVAIYLWDAGEDFKLQPSDFAIVESVKIYPPTTTVSSTGCGTRFCWAGVQDMPNYLKNPSSETKKIACLWQLPATLQMATIKKLHDNGWWRLKKFPNLCQFWVYGTRLRKDGTYDKMSHLEG